MFLFFSFYLEWVKTVPDFVGNVVKNSMPGSRVVFFKCRPYAWLIIMNLEIILGQDQHKKGKKDY